MNYEYLLEELKELCVETGSFIRDNFRKVTDSDIITKEKNSLVSYVDKEAEKRIIEKLVELIPDTGFHTEEDAVDNIQKEKQWIVDPLDGTTNFIAGIPHFSISIALKEGKEVTLGVVYNVMLDDLYTAFRGGGAFLNGQAIKVAIYSTLDDAVIATGFPYDKSKIDEKLMGALNHYVKDARALRRLGSAALDLCFMAQGTFHLYYERFLNAWDIAAGAIIVEEAGGKICDFEGGRSFLEKGEIITYCPGMDEEVGVLKSLWESE
jgi:myo-inositol-1(or 4)-monophosphatase